VKKNDELLLSTSSVAERATEPYSEKLALFQVIARDAYACSHESIGEHSCPHDNFDQIMNGRVDLFRVAIRVPI